MRRVLVFCIACLTCKFVKNDKILAIFPYQGKSHFQMFGPLMKELASRGHEVDVMGHYPLEKPMDRYTDLSLKGSLPSLTNNLSIETIGANDMFTTAMIMYKQVGADLCKVIFDTPAAKLLKNTTKKYDLLVTTIFGTDCMLGFAHHLKLPTIAIITSVNLPWSSKMIGVPDNPSYIPNYFSSFMPAMTLKERIVNTFVYFLADLGYSIYSVGESNAQARKFFGEDTPDLRDLAKKISLFLVNSHFSLHQARPVVPNFIEVGGLHIGKPKPLPKYYEDAVNSYPNGAIYLSFGSMIVSELFPEHKLQALYDALGELPYKILWKGNIEKLPQNLKIPKNIQYEKWMPQLDLLCHPSVKLFISHGGLMGTQESIYCGIPVLGIPLFADQMLNVKNSVHKGVAMHVDFKNITKASISYAAKQLLQNPQYQTNIKKASDLFRDRPMSTMDTAVYWIEYVSRYKGAPHLRSVGADLPWYQYVLLDVASVILTGFLCILIAVYYFIITVYYYFVCKHSNKSKTD